MKIKLHIPTEQYGFVEVEMEKNNEVSKSIEEVVQDAIGFYKASKSPELPSGEGLDHKEWNATLDGYITVGEMLGDAYQRMSPEQQRVIQEIKKSINRVNPREKRE